MSRETDCKILEKLAEWKQQEGLLPNIVQLYEDLLSVQCEAKSHIQGRSLAREVILERLERGDPLQPFHELPLDWSLLRDLFHQVLTHMGKRLSILTEDMEGLQNIALNGRLLRQVVEAWYKEEPLTSWILHVKNELLSTTVQASMWPFLTVQSETLIAKLDQGKWRRRYCLLCGGKADFSFLERENGARWLSCSRCDTDWLFQRLECPHCGCQDQSKLAYFSDEEGRYRLYICQHCRSYMKAIDLRKTEEDALIPLEKIMTIDLDGQAQEGGFNAGWTSKTWF